MSVTKKRTVDMSPTRLGEEEIHAAEAVLRSGRLREGPRVAEFEEAFCRHTGARHAIATSSGTASLHLAYLAMIQPGDEVITTPFTFIATASMIVHAGGIPVFCDIDPETLTLDPAEIAKNLTSKTRAVCGVHLFGNTCDMDAIAEAVKNQNISLLWDAAQSLGSTYRDRDISHYRDAVTYSFYPTKNMTTGEGGMIVTENEALARTIRLLKNHGQAQKYRHELIGLNYRMTEIEAAIGMVQLTRLSGMIEARQKAAQVYDEAFLGHPALRLQKTTEGCGNSRNYYSIILREGAVSKSRDEILEALREAGVSCAVHYPIPLHEQPCFASFRREELPNASSIASQIIALPMHPWLSSEDLSHVSTTVLGLLERFKA